LVPAGTRGIRRLAFCGDRRGICPAQNTAELKIQGLVFEWTTPLLHDLPSPDRPAEAGRLAAISGLVRRICLLREQGCAAEANRLQAAELDGAIAEFRRCHGPGSLTDEKVCTVFLHETELVQKAMLLAEIIAPQLARLLPPDRPRTYPVFPAAPMERAPVHPADGPPAISDLLDAMLAAERPGRRFPPAGQ
jgi:hypothetical protein